MSAASIELSVQSLRDYFEVGAHWTPTMLLGYASLTNSAPILAKDLALRLLDAGRDEEITAALEWAEKRRSMWEYLNNHPNKIVTRSENLEDVVPYLSAMIRAAAEGAL